MRAARTAGRIAPPERLTVKANGRQVRLRRAVWNGNIVANMSSDSARLGEVEQLVLLAVLRLEGDAYAVPIRDLIQRQTGIALARGSIYITLDRLEQKGLVDSRMSDPTPAPGGKARRVFRIRPSGVAALRAAQRAVDRLAAGTTLEKKI
jgi:PadR family transcriptional regulator, regulatory protein PadR